ncbi:unnamed protein product [Amoebophrya sp. A25]|nr:unnamed protein product [Amoebophrya sp. A25]|eukprot:GSA25T00011944001.1
MLSMLSLISVLKTWCLVLSPCAATSYLAAARTAPGMKKYIDGRNYTAHPQMKIDKNGWLIIKAGTQRLDRFEAGVGQLRRRRASSGLYGELEVSQPPSIPNLPSEVVSDRLLPFLGSLPRRALGRADKQTAKAVAPQLFLQEAKTSLENNTNVHQSTHPRGRAGLQGIKTSTSSSSLSSSGINLSERAGTKVLDYEVPAASGGDHHQVTASDQHHHPAPSSSAGDRHQMMPAQHGREDHHDRLVIISREPVLYDGNAEFQGQYGTTSTTLELMRREPPEIQWYRYVVAVPRRPLLCLHYRSDDRYDPTTADDCQRRLTSSYDEDRPSRGLEDGSEDMGRDMVACTSGSSNPPPPPTPGAEKVRRQSSDKRLRSPGVPASPGGSGVVATTNTQAEGTSGESAHEGDGVILHIVSQDDAAQKKDKKEDLPVVLVHSNPSGWNIKSRGT